MSFHQIPDDIQNMPSLSLRGRRSKRYLTETNLHNKELNILDNRKNIGKHWKVVSTSEGFKYIIILVDDDTHIGFKTEWNGKQTFKRIERC